MHCGKPVFLLQSWNAAPPLSFFRLNNIFFFFPPGKRLDVIGSIVVAPPKCYFLNTPFLLSRISQAPPIFSRPPARVNGGTPRNLLPVPLMAPLLDWLWCLLVLVGRRDASRFNSPTPTPNKEDTHPGNYFPISLSGTLHFIIIIWNG